MRIGDRERVQEDDEGLWEMVVHDLLPKISRNNQPQHCFLMVVYFKMKRGGFYLLKIPFRTI